MVRMFVRHRVDHFSEWKEVYDEFDAKRKKMGVKGAAVFQAADDDSDVTVWHDFESLDTARSFAQSSELREAMENAGVTGDPTIWFTERA